MTEHRPGRGAHACVAAPPVPRRSRTALIIHGPGKVTHIATKELAGLLETAGWSTHVERANRNDTPRRKHVDLVVGIDADIAALRTAALNEAPVLTADSGDRLAIAHLLTTSDDLEVEMSPIGIARIDRDAPTPIVQRAIVTAVDPDAELTWTSPITQQLPLDNITHIAVDVPEPRHRGPGSRSRSAMGAVMTFRSAQESSTVVLNPADDYTITTADGSDLVIHIDQHIHHIARRIYLGTHSIGLRVVHGPTSTP